MLSNENTQSGNQIHLKCNQGDIPSSEGCFKTKKDFTSEDFIIKKSTQVKDIKSTSRTLVLDFCREATAGSVKNAINFLAIKSGAKK